MKAKPWLQIATIVSAFAIAGTAAANDKDQASKKEQAGAAVNSNAPAQLGSDLNGNSAAQLGTETPKSIVPNDSDASAKGTGKGKTLIEQTPSADTSKTAPARTGSDARAADMGPANTRGK